MPAAADIALPLKGRGFAKLGPSDLIEFQSAYTGATLTEEAEVSPVTVHRFGNQLATKAASTTGPRPLPPPSPMALAHTASPPVAASAPSPPPPHQPTTHLDVLLDAVTQGGGRRGRRRASRGARCCPRTSTGSRIERPADAVGPRDAVAGT